VQSNDGSGNTYFSMFSNPQQTYTANLELDGTNGTLSIGATANMLFNLITPGLYTWLNGDATFGKAGGVNLALICSDGAGTNSLSLSSDSNATYSLRITQDNVTGNATINCSGEIKMGIADNWIFEVNGYCTIPVLPAETSDFNYTPLVRNISTGRLEYVPIGKTRMLINDSIDPALITNQYMNDNYAQVPFGVDVCFLELAGFPQGVASVFRIGTGPANFGLWAIEMTANKLP
jgi:hypothetical protein